MDNKEELQNGKNVAVKHDTIYQALAAVTREIGSIKKGNENTQQKFMYRGIEDFLNEIHTLYARHGILVFQDIQDYIIEERVSKLGSAIFYPKATVEYTFMHEGGTCHKCKLTGMAMDSADKGLNKCYAIAYKYVLMFLHNVPTKDLSDPDGESPDPGKAQASNQNGNANKNGNSNKNGTNNGNAQGNSNQAQKEKKEIKLNDDGYKKLIKWIMEDPLKHTIAMVQSNYIIDAATISQLAIDAGITVGGEKPSDTKSNEKAN